MRAEQVRLRRGVAADAAALAEFAARTFIEAFGAENNPDDLARHLAHTYRADLQERELADPGYITILAETDAGLAAFAQLRMHEAPPCVTGARPVEILRFYVDRPWHGQGVAQRLMDAVHEAAAELDGQTLWLSTWERNPRGRAFYAKVGFTDVGSADFFVGADRQTDRIFAMPVRRPG